MRIRESATYVCLIALIFTLAVIKPKPDYFQSQKLKNDGVIATIDSIYDGDTVFCNISAWPDIVGKRIGVRLNGIDTPEIHDKNPKLKFLAIEAKNELISNLHQSKTVTLKNIQRGKYFRIIADVYVKDVNMSEVLLEKNLAKKYDGNTKTQWSEEDYNIYKGSKNDYKNGND